MRFPGFGRLLYRFSRFWNGFCVLRCGLVTPGSVPNSGKLVIDLATCRAFPAAVPLVLTCRPWCRRSTPGNSASWSSTWQAPGPPRGRARGVNDRRRAGISPEINALPVPPVPSSRGRARGADVPPVVLTIDGGKLTTGKPVIVSPVVPTCRGHRPGNVPRSPWCR